ncbi:hypothetical protein TWF788_010084 [Orbilia oligospora]|uniref:DC-UbP/UBTD2 N-terminal domain-containing protein n=1 Tax=Orbilia oligospora TaxID=2813651 RepID=A0A6G1M4F4_ORBOL|nr:hypothetical protein TWF788_010084 [Orbilia oligospora]KAF3197072.1 hypothetical protein TWF679_003752 [Orbilia oligospora]KAF3197354.1 hypothetical protein TWF191_005416 [Orbilia oligospora]KAF3245272.1 hypothetical protein TWF192_007473 [Orbilia oligospora]
MGGCLSTNQGHQGPVPPGQRLDRPLKRPKDWLYNTAHGPAPTASALQRLRDDFWFTQVSGRPEIWSTIRAVCEMLMDDKSDAQLKTAREMLAAAEITLPDGTFIGGAWDKAGNNYVVPRHIISNPMNVRAASIPRNSSDSWESSESGKARMSGGPGPSDSVTTISYMIKFRVQYGHDAIDVTMQAWSDEKVKKIAKRLVKKAGLSTDTHKASVFMDGKPFDLKKKLNDPGQPAWLANRILQVFIRPTTDPQSSTSPPDPNDKLLVPFPPPAPPTTAPSDRPEAGPSVPSAENQPGPSNRERSADSKSSGESQTPTLAVDPKSD